MKTKNIFMVLALSATLSLSSCEDFLVVPTIGKSTIDTFFAEIEGLRAANNGLHRSIAEFYDDEFVRYPEIMGDMVELVRLNADEATILVHDYLSIPSHDAGYPASIWREGYNVVTNANNILYYGEPLYESYPHCKAEIDMIFAQATFARALATFNLCQVYGHSYIYTPDASHLGVPVVTWVPGFDDVIARSTVAQAYKQVLADLDAALALFTNSQKPASVYYISPLACKALKARVYLHKGDWDNAAKMAEEVMGEITLTPHDKYVKMFRDAASEVGSETIFRLNFYDTSSSMNSLCDPSRSNYKAEPAKKLLDLFEEGDVRKELLVYTPESVETEMRPGNYNAFCKYCAYKSITDERNRRTDLFVLRGSEMYLIHAEALCRKATPDLEGAANDIKALQARAMGKTVEEITLTYKDAEDLLQIIENERVRELNMEGHRLFDITRLGHDLERGATATSAMKNLSWPDYRFALPICQTEMEANEAMKQNDGYTTE